MPLPGDVIGRMRRDGSVRLLVVTVSSVLALGIAANALESAVVSAPYDAPDDAGGSSAPSLLGALGLLIAAVLEFLGVQRAPLAGEGTAGTGRLLLQAVAIFGPYAVLLVALSGVLAALSAVVRRLPAAATGLRSTVLDRTQSVDRTSAGHEESDSWPPTEPVSDVGRAWLAMTECLDAERPRTLTPAEWADLAVDEGLEADAVAELTEAFREVRYGAASETSDHSQRARRALRRLDATAPG